MKRVENAHLHLTALSHAGMRGKINEDRYAVSAFRMNDSPHTRALLAVLSDGIGGHRAGEVAAEMAVDMISASIAENGDSLPPDQALQQAIHTASQAIFEQSRANSHQEGMGATCACVFVVGTRLYTASVGDSRIYLLRAGQLHQITTDHTWVQEAVQKGVIAHDQVQGHPNAHVIRRFLGSPQLPDPDLRMRLNDEETDSQATANQGNRLKKGDVLLLCSDGLTDLVYDTEIAATLQSQPTDKAAQCLIDLANQRGGHDNVTVIVISIPPGMEENPKPYQRWVRLGCLAVLLVIGLAVGLALGFPGFWELRTKTPIVPTVPAMGFPLPPTGQETPQQTIQTDPRVATPIPLGILTPTGRPGLITTLPPPNEATLTPWPTNTILP